MPVYNRITPLNINFISLKKYFKKKPVKGFKYTETKTEIFQLLACYYVCCFVCFCVVVALICHKFVVVNYSITFHLPCNAFVILINNIKKTKKGNK